MVNRLGFTFDDTVSTTGIEYTGPTKEVFFLLGKVFQVVDF